MHLNLIHFFFYNFIFVHLIYKDQVIVAIFFIFHRKIRTPLFSNNTSQQQSKKKNEKEKTNKIKTLEHKWRKIQLTESPEDF